METDLIGALQDAHRRYGVGDLEAAERQCARLLKASPQWGDAWRLFGMIARKRGDLAAAETRLRQALALQPGHAEALNSLALVLADADRLAEAQEILESALHGAPDYGPAYQNLARVQSDRGLWRNAVETLARARARLGGSQLDILYARALARAGDPRAAAEIYRAVLVRAPESDAARYGLAGALTDMGEEAGALEALQDLDPTRTPGLGVARLRALIGLGRLEEAEREARASIRCRAPYWRDSLSILAQALWMSGAAPDVIDSLFAPQPDDPADAAIFAETHAEILQRQGRLEAALAVIENASKPGPRAWALARRTAEIRLEQGDPERALAILDAAGPVQSPAPDRIRVQARLMRGEGEAARAEIAQARRARPLDQYWIAMALEADRLLHGDALKVTADGFVEVYDLAAPAGYRTMAAFNADLKACLDALHVYRRRPLDQSLRGGVQTHSNLIFYAAAPLAAFFQTVSAAASRFAQTRPALADHPFHLQGGRARGSLRPGRCVWVPGAHTWTMSIRRVGSARPTMSTFPKRSPARLTAKVGCGSALRLSQFQARALRHVEPRPGRLVLFPSHLWHGVEPIRQGERLTIAFDCVPA